MKRAKLHNIIVPELYITELDPSKPYIIHLPKPNGLDDVRAYERLMNALKNKGIECIAVTNSLFDYDVDKYLQEINSPNIEEIKTVFKQIQQKINEENTKGEK